MITTTGLLQKFEIIFHFKFKFMGIFHKLREVVKISYS